MDALKILESVGALFGFACVFFYTRRNLLSWPTGIVQVLIYIYIFYEVKLYSDMLLQVVFVLLQIYGWTKWMQGEREDGEIRIQRMNFQQFIYSSTICLICTFSLGTAMKTWTDASFPYVDAFAAILSLIAQWLIARRILENWLYWIVIDIVSIGLYLCKDLYYTTALYVLFLCLSIFGFYSWYTIIKTKEVKSRSFRRE